MAFTAFYGDWQTISIAAAALSIVGSTMLIMLSRLLGLRNLEQIAKTEFVYAGSTVLIVMMVLGIVQYGEWFLANGSSGVVRGMYLASFGYDPSTPVIFSQNTLIDWMKLYMETATRCVQKFMNVLYAISIPIEACTSVYMEIFMSEHASGFACKFVAERINNATQSFSFYMYAFFLITHVLNFVKYYAGFFFSIGVVLRAFPPTRGGGAYLMAISLGVYFVLPFSYILVSFASLPYVQSDLLVSTPHDLANPAMTTCMLPQISDPRDYQCEGASATSAFSIPGRIRANAAVIKDLITGPDPKIFSLGQHLVSAVCILPMIAFVILMTFVLNTTNLFGGNIPEIGRGLVKLI